MGLDWQEFLIVFGAGKPTDVGSALGRGIKEFKAEAAGEEPDAAVAAGTGGNDEGRGTEPRGLRTDQV